MENYYITIAREYGSGGRIIGQKLAEQLGIKFYDREIISMVAKESGLNEDYVESVSESYTPFFLYNIYESESVPFSNQIYLAESSAIASLADSGPGVFIGRNSSEILKNYKNVINVFIHAPLEYRTAFAVEYYKHPEEHIKKEIQRIDKGRNDYIKRFSGKGWLDIRSYNITVDSSIGIDPSVEVIKTYIDQRLQGTEV